MHILLSHWTEPCEGDDAQVVAINDEEAGRIQNVIDWLKKNAGQSYGHTLCSWELLPTKANIADLVGVESVLDWIALNSRYNETGIPGDYYGGNTNADLDNRAGVII